MVPAPLRSVAPSPAGSNILEYGALPDGRTLNTVAIQRAIDDVHRSGGGTVYAPAGTFLTGGLELRSRVTLYLEGGCCLLGSASIADFRYHPGPPKGADANGYHLLFAQNADDVTVCGPGVIDGQGAAYWEPNVDHEAVTPEDAWKDGSTGYNRPRDHNRRPSPMLEFAACRNVRVRDVTLRNAPGWTLRPIACETVLLDGIRIRNPNSGPNTDGFDITDSRNVFVSNCDIVTGDDAICLKSENPYGESRPTKNVTITNCSVTTSCNGFKMGTASHGAFENILFSNSVISNDASSPMNTRASAGVCVEMVDGGTVDGVVISHIRMENVRAPIFVRLGTRRKRKGTFLRNVRIEGIEATGAIVSSSITGVPGFRPSNITVSGCRIRTVEAGRPEWALRTIPEVAEEYPEARMMGRLPAYGFYVRHADRVRLRDIECITDRPDGRPAIVCDDVNDVTLSELDLSTPTGDGVLIRLDRTRIARLAGVRASSGHPPLVEVRGADSAGIRLPGSSSGGGEVSVRYVGGATHRATDVSRADRGRAPDRASRGRPVRPR
jgi:Glycosyl hydrolases family 28